MNPMLTYALIAILAFVAVAAVGFAFAGPQTSVADRATKRAREFTGAVSRRRALFEDASLVKRKQATAEALKTLAETQKNSRARRFSVSGRMSQAGLNLSPTMFWAGSLGLGVVLALLTYIFTKHPFATVGALAVGGFGAPRWVLGMLTEKRQKQFSAQLADGMDIIVRGVKSGLPLTQCLQIIAAESPSPLRDEFQRLVDAQQMGVPFDQALARFFDRMPLPEVNFFCIVLLIQQKSGGNLSEALGNLSGVLRARKMLKEKIKALSGEAKMSAIIIGVMPIVVAGILMILNPAYVTLLVSTEPGRMILMASAVSYATGIYIMRSMLNFRF